MYNLHEIAGIYLTLILNTKWEGNRNFQFLSSSLIVNAFVKIVKNKIYYFLQTMGSSSVEAFLKSIYFLGQLARKRLVSPLKFPPQGLHAKEWLCGFRWEEFLWVHRKRRKYLCSLMWSQQ